MKLAGIFFWITGLALLIGLIAWQGFAKVGAAFAEVGWGLPVICVYFLLPMTANTFCWQLLLPTSTRPPLRTLLVLRWVCGSVNTLLPVAQVGGELVRARLLTFRGVRGSDAGASAVVDVTIAAATQSVFSIIGILILLQYDVLTDTAYAAAFGLFIFCILLISFFVAQRYGLFYKITRLFEKSLKVGDWKNITGGAKELDEAILSTYSRRRALAFATAWRTFGLIIGSGQVMLVFYFLGYPISFVEAIMLESLGHAMRNVAFMIPGALGVQEGGYMLLGHVVGAGPEIGLVFSLIMRARSLVLGLPGLAVWQLIEGRKLLMNPKEVTPS
jgi:putative membrane protein